MTILHRVTHWNTNFALSKIKMIFRATFGLLIGFYVIMMCFISWTPLCLMDQFVTLFEGDLEQEPQRIFIRRIILSLLF